MLDISDQAISWRDLEVCREPCGEVSLALTGRAAAIARRAGISALSLNLAHDRGRAAEVMLAEIDKSADT